MKALIFIIFLGLFSILSCDNWVLLVAGSNGYWNYRHQSDIYHMYQIARKNGIPDDHIIVMHYDDIAYNSENPKKGTVINEPGGPNNYPGVPKDYVGSEVTPSNFLKILKNEDMGMHKKSFKTGPKDDIFIYFADHGAAGLIAFPSSYLYAKDLMEALKYMHDNNLYKRLVFYLEACESGSMFNGLLPEDWNMWATTASNPSQSSYACYYDSTFKTYLADCYSINFMNSTENHDIYSYTLEQQYEEVKKITTQSPTCLYGDKSMGSLLIGEFQGKAPSMRTRSVRKIVPTKIRSSVDSRDAKLSYLQRRVSLTNNMEERNYYIKQLDEYTKEINKMDVAWNAFKSMMNIEINQSNDDGCYKKETVALDCMKETVEYAKQLGLATEYSIKYFSYLNAACQQKKSSSEINKVLEKVSQGVF